MVPKINAFKVERSQKNVPHFKGLINTKVDLEAQGRDTTFTLCHAQLKTPSLLLKMAKGAAIFLSHCKTVIYLQTTFSATLSIIALFIYIAPYQVKYLGSS